MGAEWLWAVSVEGIWSKVEDQTDKFSHHSQFPEPMFFLPLGLFCFWSYLKIIYNSSSTPCYQGPARAQSPGGLPPFAPLMVEICLLRGYLLVTGRAHNRSPAFRMRARTQIPSIPWKKDEVLVLQMLPFKTWIWKSITWRGKTQRRKFHLLGSKTGSQGPSWKVSLSSDSHLRVTLHVS